MRKISTTALILMLAATSAARAQETLAPADGPRHLLVADGSARAAIVLPEKPDALETYAAGELARYAKQITGASLPIVREPEQPTGYAVWLGRTQKAESAGFTLTEAKLGRDGYAARADDHGLVVVGRCPLATLFGTYDLIEREFGVVRARRAGRSRPRRRHALRRHVPPRAQAVVRLPLGRLGRLVAQAADERAGAGRRQAGRRQLEVALSHLRHPHPAGEAL